jgi:hypothetical protein
MKPPGTASIKPKIDRMASAFEHEDLKVARAG